MLQDPEHKKQIGLAIKAARERVELNQTQVGEVFETSKATVSGWERGANYPDLGVFVKLVKLYKTTADHLLFGGPTMSPRTLDLARRLEAIQNPELRRFTFANVESMIVNAEENRGRMVLNPEEKDGAQEARPASAPSLPRTQGS